MNDALDISETLSLSWSTFTKEAVPLIGATIIAGLITTFTFGLLVGPMAVGYFRTCLKAARGEAVAMTNVFEGCSYFIPSTLLVILVTIAVTLGTLCLVIPGIIIAALCFWSLAIMADGDTGIVSCISKSASYVKQNIVPTVIFVIVTSIISSLGGVVAIGVLVTAPIGTVMIAYGYLRAFKSNDLPEEGIS